MVVRLFGKILTPSSSKSDSGSKSDSSSKSDSGSKSDSSSRSSSPPLIKAIKEASNSSRSSSPPLITAIKEASNSSPDPIAKPTSANKPGWRIRTSTVSTWHGAPCWASKPAGTPRGLWLEGSGYLSRSNNRSSITAPCSEQHILLPRLRLGNPRCYAPARIGGRGGGRRSQHPLRVCRESALGDLGGRLGAF